MSTQYRSTTGYRQSIPYEGATAQFARPTADDVVGNWITSPLYSKINETPYDDGVFIQSEPNPIFSTCRVKISSLTDPSVSTGHIVRYRYQKNLASEQPINIVVRLYQGATIIAQATHTDVGNPWTSGSFTLSGTEADSITDYTDLYIQFEAQGS